MQQRARWALLEQRSTYECAERDKGRAADERIVRDCCEGGDQARCHCRFRPRPLVNASNFPLVHQDRAQPTRQGSTRTVNRLDRAARVLRAAAVNM